MRKAYLRFVSICTLFLFLLSGCNCSPYAEDSEYLQKKKECIDWIADNKESIDIIVQQLDTYGFGMDIYCEDGVFEMYGQAGTEKPSAYAVLSNDELMENLSILFENEYIDSVSKTKFKGETDYSYSIHFVTIRKAFTCTAYLARNAEEASAADEHITGDWYYMSRINV
ncbi:MAG: hypothetical protein E7546_00660 [Ruminococcaceae bacterium]|nr:hypothetical protein [Oscillospiraceae bacterium]